MSKKVNNQSDFGYLGHEFQIRLFQQILLDTRFSDSILPILSPNYFDDENLRVLAGILKNAWDKDETLLNYKTLEIRVRKLITNEVQVNILLSLIKEIEDVIINDADDIKKTGRTFCKKQELKKTLKTVDKIIEKGTLDDYDKIEGLIKDALELGNEDNSVTDLFQNIEDVLDEDYRNPIPTGIVGLDGPMNGGLGPTELGVILAAYGVGKTTILTYIANHAKAVGKNVLQIFFEDNPKVIQRKHLSKWSGYELNDLPNHKEEVMEIANREKNTGGILKLAKFSSSGITMPYLKQYIRKLIAQGFKPDLITLDYIDVVQSVNKYDSDYGGEGEVMREFESMLGEFEIAGWTAVQGNRGAITADVVGGEHMGGSIKKAQVGHFLASIAKGLEQKEGNRANLTIIKNRFGPDGIIYEDIVFDNGRMLIDTDTSSGISYSDAKVNKDRRNQDIVANALRNVKEERQNNNNNNNNNEE
jgi:hypothetical protein